MITIALPNKGRLSEKGLELFERAGLRAEFTSERALVATLGNDFRAIFVRAPTYLSSWPTASRRQGSRGQIW